MLYLAYLVFLKWTNPGLLYCLFSVISNKHNYNFYNKYMWKNVHLEYDAGIQTHNLPNMSLLQQPLDQGSRPT